MHKLALSLVLLLSACTARELAPSAPAPAPVATPAQAASAGASGQTGTLARIRALAADASCTGDAECRSLPLGARPCGGPDGYLAFSVIHASETELRALAQAYADERRKANSESGLVSTCLFQPDPGAVCKAGQCRLGTVQPASVQ